VRPREIANAAGGARRYMEAAASRAGMGAEDLDVKGVLRRGDGAAVAMNLIVIDMMLMHAALLLRLLILQLASSKRQSIV
jgi:hypothetical protein